MFRLSSVVLGLALALGATSASAKDAADKNFRIGARFGYAIPGGNLGNSGSSSLHDNVSHQIPIAIDVGYLLTPHLLVGAYGQYGFATHRAQPYAWGGARGSASDLNFGVQAQYHSLLSQMLDPWVGLGAGYEILDQHNGDLDTLRLRGFEFAKLQAGLDFQVSDTFALGPFLSYSLGEYSNYKVTGGGLGSSGDIAPKSMHEWFTVGVKGAFAL
jgi:outer membrane protein W